MHNREAREARKGISLKQERWLSVDEVASHLGVKRDTVYKWIERKGMPSHKVGRLWRFKISEIDDWVHRGCTRVESTKNKGTR